MSITSLIGCSENKLPDNGTIDYECLDKCKIITFKYKDDTTETYICLTIGRNPSIEFHDIKTNQIVIKLSSTTRTWNYQDELNSCMVSYEMDNIHDFLIKENNIKEEYTKEDVDKIIEDYKNYKNNVNKVLTK